MPYRSLIHFEARNLTIETTDNQGVNITTNSTTIVAANSYRRYLIIVNDSDTVIYLAFGAAAVVNSGVRLNANGGAYEMNWLGVYLGAVNGIHGGTGNKRVTVVEGRGTPVFA